MGEKIRELAIPMLTDESQFIVNIAVSALQGPQKVTIVLDGDNGITIDDCAALSRKLSDAMEEGGLIGENFTIEVTTPGVDKPLQLQRQYVKNVGRGLKVHLSDKTAVTGKLIGATISGITLEQEIGEGKKKEHKIVTLPFSSIEKAFVQVSFK